MTGLFGGAFNPPHNGHVELARRAKEQFGLDGLVVLVSASPGHKRVDLDAGTRLRLVRAAFPDDDVRIDEHPRTVDMLEGAEWDDPVFLIGADEFASFLTWKDPDGVTARARVAVATRPGYPRERLDAVLAGLSRPERVLFFEIDPWPVSSEEIRARVARGENVDDVVPAPVASLIDELGLYHGYTAPDQKDLTNR